jgi:high-affinity iron transporter
LSLRTFFAVTSVLLLLICAGLVSAGIGRLQGLGVLSPSAPLWDTSSLVTDQSLAGTFLNGFIGYRARPSAPEVAGWLGYLLVAGGFYVFPTRRNGLPATASLGARE